MKHAYRVSMTIGLLSGLLASFVVPPAHAAEPALKQWELILPGETVSVLGRKVLDPEGDQIGRITDVLFDRGGQPRAAVIDFGGFLGVGSRKIAVDWQLLTLEPMQRDAPVLVRLEKGDLQGAPEYKDPPQPTAMIGLPAGSVPSPTNAGE
jgi:hypothetical protein